jgi:(hydroxyamino)benzene mutase
MTAIFLAKAGLWLFLFGLLIGVAIPKFTNPRLGLSAHLTAVQSGTALMAIAWFWPELTEGNNAAALIGHALWLSLWVLVIGQTLSAAWGASKALPMAGAGYSASALKEGITWTLIYGSSIALMLALAALLTMDLF